MFFVLDETPSDAFGDSCARSATFVNLITPSCLHNTHCPLLIVAFILQILHAAYIRQDEDQVFIVCHLEWTLMIMMNHVEALTEHREAQHQAS
jgi:hypothetical protein